MITIGEEILLLALDYDTGGMNFRIPGRALQCALGGAVLTDLALAGRIDTDAGSLFSVDPAPLGEPAQDRTLERIVADGKRRTTDYWVAALLEDYDALRAALMDRLVARGILCGAGTAGSGSWAPTATRAKTGGPCGMYGKGSPAS